MQGSLAPLEELVKRIWIALWARFCLLLTSRVRLKHQKPGRLKLSKFANILIIGFWRIASVTLFQEQSLMYKVTFY
jgi:hypothetical protein